MLDGLSQSKPDLKSIFQRGSPHQRYWYSGTSVVLQNIIEVFSWCFSSSSKLYSQFYRVQSTAIICYGSRISHLPLAWKWCFCEYFEDLFKISWMWICIEVKHHQTRFWSRVFHPWWLIFIFISYNSREGSRRRQGKPLESPKALSTRWKYISLHRCNQSVPRWCELWKYRT